MTAPLGLHQQQCSAARQAEECLQGAKDERKGEGTQKGRDVLREAGTLEPRLGREEEACACFRPPCWVGGGV